MRWVIHRTSRATATMGRLVHYAVPLVSVGDCRVISLTSYSMPFGYDFVDHSTEITLKVNRSAAEVLAARKKGIIHSKLCVAIAAMFWQPLIGSSARVGKRYRRNITGVERNG